MKTTNICVLNVDRMNMNFLRKSIVLFLLAILIACSSDKEDLHVDQQKEKLIIEDNQQKKDIGSITQESKGEVKLSLIKELFPDKLNWKKIDTVQYEGYKQRLVDRITMDFTYIKESEYQSDGFLDNFHMTNLNGDSLNDILFHGWSGGEPDMLCGFINEGDSLRKVFCEYQDPLEISIQKKGLQKLRMIDRGCCDAYMTQIMDYSYNGDSLRLLRDFAYISWGQLEGYNMGPIRFKTINPIYTLRSTPMIDDTTVFRNESFGRGNVIGELKQGTEGTAYLKDTDDTGRVWWLVITEPIDTLSNTHFYDDPAAPTHYIGWLSSRYVEIID